MKLPNGTKLTPEELRKYDADGMDINLMNIEVKPSSFGFTHNELCQINSEALNKALNERREWSDPIKQAPEFKDVYRQLRENTQKNN